MQVRAKFLQKKVIVAATIISAFFLIGYFLFGQKQKPVLKPLITSSEITPGPTVTVKMVNYEDPLGFTFSYPSKFKVNIHPEDQINYADVELTNQDKTQNFKFVVSDTNYSDINTWALNDNSVKEGSSLDSKLGSLAAKKVYLSKTNKIIIGTIWDKMLLTLEFTPADDKNLTASLNDILSSLNIPKSANYTSGSAETSSNNTSGSGDSGIEEVVE
ncbi:MAG: hypothetical protein M1120_03080 [Patescibacteria group bacterium]|nr:hypothetical protein [Patescibacteria group bacterium]